MNVIEVRGLKKSFDATVVLDSISMTVHQGDIYGFLGPNGSGKTTTLRILSGIIAADEGQITVLGMSPASSGQTLRKRVNVLPESHGLYGWMSAHGYLRFFSQLYGIEFSADELRARLRQVGLDPEDQRPIRKFSRGMKQRLGTARAIVNDAALLFLDEPTNGLDPRGRREVHDLLLKLNHERDLTMIISTHILDDVERLCNRIAILDRGKVRYEGPLAYDQDRRTVRYRFHLGNGGSLPSPWEFPGISLAEKKDRWITCSIEGISPAQAIKTLVEGHLPIIEAQAVSGGLEDLYLVHTTGGTA
jgi:ABC-2 type transport system ATP-binding protein